MQILLQKNFLKKRKKKHISQIQLREPLNFFKYLYKKTKVTIARNDTLQNFPTCYVGGTLIYLQQK